MTCGFGLWAAIGPSPRGAVLAEAQARGVLRAVTVAGPTTYFLGAAGAGGFEFDLARAYADAHGLALDIKVAASADDALAVLDAGGADLAVGIVASPGRRLARSFGPAYRTGEHMIVCRVGAVAADTVADLAGADGLVLLAPDGAAVEALLGLAAEAVHLHWRADEALDPGAALARVSDGGADCAVVDDRAYALERRYRPNLRAVGALPAPVEHAWAIGGGGGWRGVSLERDLARWFDRPSVQRTIGDIEERYFGFRPEDVEAGHAVAFRRAIDSRLARYRPEFEREAKAAGLPWTLVAALAYQESHWDPEAVSRTGVRGLMMLTRATAAEVGVEDRTDAESSIAGGVRYYKRLLDRLPRDIRGEERYWFAAAAYNFGWSSLMDARALAAERGLNPDRWADVRDILPEMENPEVYRGLPNGRANGREAQEYVRRVRDFADILDKRFPPDGDGVTDA